MNVFSVALALHKHENIIISEHVVPEWLTSGIIFGTPILVPGAREYTAWIYFPFLY